MKRKEVWKEARKIWKQKRKIKDFNGISIVKLENKEWGIDISSNFFIFKNQIQEFLNSLEKDV